MVLQEPSPPPGPSCLPLLMAAHLASSTRIPHTTGKQSDQKPWDITAWSPTSQQVKIAPAHSPDGGTVLAGWHPLFRLVVQALLRDCCQG